MTAPHNAQPVPDEQLVAYLDGELPLDAHEALARQLADDPELQRRILVLLRGNRPFQLAFDPLLARAPEQRLQAMLSRLESGPRRPAPSRWRAPAAMAAGLVLFFAGLTADHLIPDLGSAWDRFTASSGPEQDEDDWRQAVAEYLTLYSADTLASIPDDDAMRQRELDSLRAKLAVNLSAEKAAVPGLVFKRAQLFEYDRKPLGQVAYLDPETGPAALCIIRSDDEDAAQRVEQRQGFNIVYWTQGGHDFMVIGRMPVSRLQELARTLSGRLAG